MASPDDIASFARVRTADPDTASLIPKLPELPSDVKKRFPSMDQWEKDMEAWRVKTTIAIRGGTN